jgi:hypothetical protein
LDETSFEIHRLGPKPQIFNLLKNEVKELVISDFMQLMTMVKKINAGEDVKSSV